MVVCLYLFKDIMIQRVSPVEFYEKNKWLRHLSQLKSQTLSNFAACLEDLSMRTGCADMRFKQTRKYCIFAVNSLVVMTINNVIR